ERTRVHRLGGRLNGAFVRGYQSRWMQNFAAVPGVRAVGPWNERSAEDQLNREVFEESVDIILRAWSSDTFAYGGKFWRYPAEPQLPHDHPAQHVYGRGVSAD